MKGIGAVIVTFNSGREIGACLDALGGRVERVVVVDNASADGTRDEVRQRPAAALICNPENRGFAAGVNQGIQALDLPFILLLNPDAVLLTGVEPLAEACRRPGVGAAAGKLVDEKGRPQAGFSVRRFPTPFALSFEALGINRIWPGNPVNRRYRCLDLDFDLESDVEQPAGAFLMIRRDAWEALGGFDEGFEPLWFEDVDFLKRLAASGCRVRYVPAAAARHAGGHSVSRMPPQLRQACWYSSLLRYVFKHFQPAGRVATWAAVVAGYTMRTLYRVCSQWNLEPLRVYGKVIRFACLRLLSGRNGEAGHSPARARQ